MPLLPNRLQGKGAAGEVFGRHRAQAQAAEVAAPGQLDLLDYLGPGIDGVAAEARRRVRAGVDGGELHGAAETVERRSEEHTSELQSLMRISYAVFCLKKKNNINFNNQTNPYHEQ